MTLRRLGLVRDVRQTHSVLALRMPSVTHRLLMVLVGPAPRTPSAMSMDMSADGAERDLREAAPRVMPAVCRDRGEGQESSQKQWAKEQRFQNQKSHKQKNQNYEVPRYLSGNRNHNSEQRCSETRDFNSGNRFHNSGNRNNSSGNQTVQERTK